MNLFELLVNFNQRSKEKSFVETIGRFTGKRNLASKLTKLKRIMQLDYYEYEIEYEANGEMRKGYYQFYPLADPDPEEIKGTTIHIRYNKRKPYIFEKLVDFSD